jgi:hypothetical protein
MSRGGVSCCFSVKPKHNDSFTLFTRAEAKRNETTGEPARAVRLGKALAPATLLLLFMSIKCYDGAGPHTLSMSAGNEAIT